MYARSDSQRAAVSVLSKKCAAWRPSARTPASYASSLDADHLDYLSELLAVGRVETFDLF